MFSGKSIANVRPRRIQSRRARSLSARCHILANHPAPISSGEAIEGKVAATDNDDAPFLVALWRRLWPLAGLALALLVTVAWIGALAYGLL